MGGPGRICERLHQNASDCYNLVAEEVLVDVYLHGMIEVIEFTWRTYHSLSFPS